MKQKSLFFYGAFLRTGSLHRLWPLGPAAAIRNQYSCPLLSLDIVWLDLVTTSSWSQLTCLLTDFLTCITYAFAPCTGSQARSISPSRSPEVAVNPTGALTALLRLVNFSLFFFFESTYKKNFNFKIVLQTYFLNSSETKKQMIKCFKETELIRREDYLNI